MTTRKADGPPRLIDARGLKCPWPVLRAARAMRECPAVDLLADDPVALVDVPALAMAHDWSVTLHDQGAFTRFELKMKDGGPGR